LPAYLELLERLVHPLRDKLEMPSKKEKRHHDCTTELAAMLPPERVTRARKEVRKAIFRIRLAHLRKRILLFPMQTMSEKLPEHKDFG
jgi:hypothetical protein